MVSVRCKTQPLIVCQHLEHMLTQLPALSTCAAAMYMLACWFTTSNPQCLGYVRLTRMAQQGPTLYMLG